MGWDVFAPAGRRHWRSAARVDVIAGEANERGIAPLDAHVVEENVLAFAAVILAIHHLHICLWGVWICAFEAVDAVIAVSGNRVLRGRFRTILILGFLVVLGAAF